MNKIKFTGIMPALVSPLNEDGTVREASLRKLIRWHLEAGCAGFYICGATGEGPVMQSSERKAVAEIAVDEVAGKGKIISHIGAIDLITAKDLAVHAKKAGVDAISSVPPFFYGYGEKEITQYYEALSDAADIPLLMYASPLSGVKITCEMVEKMMGIKTMIGLKWTSYDYYDMKNIKDIDGGNINVLNGPDETLLCGLTMGADGGIGGTYNVMPRVFVNIYNAYMAGDMKTAREEQFKANRLIRVLLKFGVINGVKDILNLLGYETGHCTYPMKRFDEAERSAFRAALYSIEYPKLYI